MNGGTRLSYYNYTIEVKCLHIYFVVSVILHLDANIFHLFIICLLIYIYVTGYGKTDHFTHKIDFSVEAFVVYLT